MCTSAFVSDFSEVVVIHVINFLTVQLLITFGEELEWTLQDPKGKDRAVTDICRCVLRDSVEYEWEALDGQGSAEKMSACFSVVFLRRRKKSG